MNSLKEPKLDIVSIDHDLIGTLDILKNITKDGVEQIYENLSFDGDFE